MNLQLLDENWQSQYLDGEEDFPHSEETDSEENTYNEFENDISDDYIVWLKNIAQTLYYREPYKPSQG